MSDTSEYEYESVSEPEPEPPAFQWTPLIVAIIALSYMHGMSMGWYLSSK